MAIIKAYKGKAPRLDRPAFLAETAVLAGDVALAPQTSVFYGAVLRADSGSITVGEGTNIRTARWCTPAPTRMCASAECDGGPLRAGARLHRGRRRADRHARHRDERAVIGEGSIVGAGALVTENFVLPPRTVAVGVPAKICGKVRPRPPPSWKPTRHFTGTAPASTPPSRFCRQTDCPGALHSAALMCYNWARRLLDVFLNITCPHRAFPARRGGQREEA